MTTFPLRLTDELKTLAAAQAQRSGVSLNQYIATIVAVQVGAQAEAERLFAARASRVKRGTALEILSRAGLRPQPREGDELSC